MSLITSKIKTKCISSLNIGDNLYCYDYRHNKDYVAKIIKIDYISSIDKYKIVFKADNWVNPVQMQLSVINQGETAGFLKSIGLCVSCNKITQQDKEKIKSIC